MNFRWKVTNPRYGETELVAESCLEALKAAAKQWGCEKWTDIAYSSEIVSLGITPSVSAGADSSLRDGAEAGGTSPSRQSLSQQALTAPFTQGSLTPSVSAGADSSLGDGAEAGGKDLMKNGKDEHDSPRGRGAGDTDELGSNAGGQVPGTDDAVPRPKRRTQKRSGSSEI